MKEYKYYFVYQTKNLINDKTYIGVHQTNNLNDGYIGCGISSQASAKSEVKRSNTTFSKAVVKYGYENFKRQIIGFYDSYEECLEEEKYLVNEDWIKLRTNYNIALGGRGRKGWKMDAKHREALNNKVCKEYVIVNLFTGEIFNIKNLKDFCRKYHVSSSGLNEVVNGRQKSCGKIWWGCRKENWTGQVQESKKERFLYKEKITLIKVYDKYGNLYEFDSIESACEKLNMTPKNVYNLRKGKVKNSNGYSLSKDVLCDVFLISGQKVYVENITNFAKTNNYDARILFRLKKGEKKKYKDVSYLGKFLKEKNNEERKV